MSKTDRKNSFQAGEIKQVLHTMRGLKAKAKTLILIAIIPPLVNQPLSQTPRPAILHRHDQLPSRRPI